MRQWLRVAIILFCLVLPGPKVGRAAPNCDGSELINQIPDLATKSCVMTCSKIFRMTDAKPIAHFEKSCHQFNDTYSKPTTAKDILDSSGRVVNEAVFQCLPLAAKKFVVGNYEFARAIPSMLTSLYNTGVDTGGRLSQKLLGCGHDVTCRRNIARTMIKYRGVNPDSSWKIPDSQVDAEIAGVSTEMLVQSAKSDQFVITKECNQISSDVTKRLMASSPQWGVEQDQKVYDQIAADHGDCIPVLKLKSPRENQPAPANQAECFKTKADPLECLSTMEKIAVGSACLGEEFNSYLQQAKIDFCGDVVQAVIPVPVGGVATRILGRGAAVEAEASTVVRGATGASGRVGADLTEAAERQSAQVGAKAPNGSGASAGAAPAPTQAASIVKTPQLNSFIESYKDRVFVQPAENRRFMDLAAQSAKDSSRTRFFDVENSVMKKLNDVTGDKNLVTSLTNYQKEIMLSHIDELRAKFPNVQFEVYSDFKSVKIAVKQTGPIDAKLDAELLKGLDEVYRKSNAEFAAKMKELRISVAEAGDASEWFKAGYGQNVDEAATAARKARQASSSAGVVNFSDARVQQSLTARLGEVEADRLALAQSQRMQPLLQSSGNGTMFPKQDVFDLTRKYSDPDQLAAAIKNRYGLSEFTRADAVQLQTYSRGVDEFSPTILIAKRENVNLDSAHAGGASADFLGMGSANTLATAQGIAGRATVAEALAGARSGEVAVTRTFQGRMEAFRRVVGGQVTCSGDDCVRIASQALTERDKSKMLANLANNPETRGVRMAFVGEGVPQAARMQLSTHGELIEKTFRKELEGKLPFEKLQAMTFGFDMKTATLNEGTVNLVIGRASSVTLSAAELEQMNLAFQRALTKYNQGVHQYTRGAASVSNRTLRLVPGAGVPGALGGSDDSP